MSMHAVLSPSTTENRRFDGASATNARRIGLGLMLSGAAASGVIALWHHQRFFSAYLVAFAFLLSVTLGGLFFVIVQHLVRAGWSVTVRRVSEVITLNIGLLFVLFLPLIPMIYTGKLMPMSAAHVAAHHGAHDQAGHGGEGGHGGEAGHGDAAHETAAAPRGDWNGPALPWVVHGEVDHSKQTWLSFPWVVIRLVVCFALWFLMARYYYGNSVRQDESGDPRHTERMQRWSAPAMLIYGLTVSIAGFDLLMALEPAWYSTMFGVYFFAGGLLGFFAALVLALYLLQRSGRLTESVTPEHYHDVGKFMFAFLVFWAYIAFAQYMLIWYANIPEETLWYQLRQTGQWLGLSVFLILGHFALPFMLLISRYPKRRPALLALGAAYVLVAHFFDMFWVVVPQKAPLGVMPVPLLDAFMLLALGGLYFLNTARNLRGIDLIPVRDPRLLESLNHQNY